jgi:hypothetical protein
MAITMIQSRAWQGLDESHTRGVLRFMSHCFKDGGYSLLPEWKPSAYGTRLALQILDRLGRPMHHMAEMTAFISHLFWRHQEGGAGYRGLPGALAIQSDGLVAT